MRPLPLLAALLACATASLAPVVARAAACCGTGHGIGQRLADSENAAIISSVGFATRVGSWDSGRTFAPISSGDFDHELRGELGWLVRVKRRVQVGFTVPVLHTWREAGELGSSGGGLGDVTAIGRLDLLAPGAHRFIPGVTLTLAALVPTGRSADAAKDVLNAGATGLGTAEIRPGITLEKTWMEGWFAIVAGSVGFRTPHVSPSGLFVQSAPRWQVVAAAGPSWSSGVSASLGLSYERESGPSIDGVVAPESARERTAALVFAAYDVSARWTAFASSQIDVPLSLLGKNESASVALSMGLRYVWGMHD